MHYFLVQYRLETIGVCAAVLTVKTGNDRTAGISADAQISVGRYQIPVLV